MNKGATISGLGHAGLILWVVMGDWLFAPRDMPVIAVAEVSLISNAEFEAMLSAVPAAPEPAPEAAAATAPEPAPEMAAAPDPAPEPVETPAPVAEPSPEPQPETLPESPAPQPVEAPAPVAPLAEDEQPVPVLTADLPPKPRPIDRVAAVPVENPDPAPEVAETPTPSISDAPAEEPVVVPDEPEAAPDEATTQIITEAVDTEPDAPQLAPTSSRRPQARAVREAVAEPAPDEPAPSEPATDPDAVAAALAEATAEPVTAEPVTAEPGPSGPPMTGSDKEALRVAVKACWALGAISSEAMRTVVTVRVDVALNGRPEAGSIRMTGFDGGSEAAARLMFEVARRAIIRCGKNGFPLPPEKFDQWKDLELVFDPNGMRLR